MIADPTGSAVGQVIDNAGQKHDSIKLKLNKIFAFGFIR